jgi:hypothetical protein
MSHRTAKNSPLLGKGCRLLAYGQLADPNTYTARAGPPVFYVSILTV